MGRDGEEQRTVAIQVLPQMDQCGDVVRNVLEDVEQPDQCERAAERQCFDPAADETRARAVTRELQSLGEKLHTDHCRSGAGLLEHGQQASCAASHLEHSSPGPPGTLGPCATRGRADDVTAIAKPEMPLFGRKRG